MMKLELFTGSRHHVRFFQTGETRADDSKYNSFTPDGLEQSFDSES